MSVCNGTKLDSRIRPDFWLSEEMEKESALRCRKQRRDAMSEWEGEMTPPSFALTT
jgi:hypothetical protein